MENQPLSPETVAVEARTKTIGALLDSVDARLGKITAGVTTQGLPILIEMDEISQRLENYPGNPESIKPEKAQFEYVQAVLRGNMGVVLRSLGGAAALKELRAQRQPPEDHWWWRLDELTAAHRSALLRRAGVIGGVTLVVLALLVVLYQAFLAPDPETLARLQHQRLAETALMQGNLETALAEVEQALVYDPGNAELLVMQAIGQQLTGREAEAQVSFARLEERFVTREAFLLQRAMYYNQFNRSDLALEDALEVLEGNPRSALGNYYAGIASENLGAYMEALRYYEAGYDLAIEQDQSTLAATIRMNMGMLMQAMPGLITQGMGEAEESGE